MLKTTKIRVLLVDDNLDSSKVISQIISQEEDLEVASILSRADQLAGEVEEMRPDVVLLDMSMPGMDPIEAMKASMARVPGVRFVVLSAYDLPKHRELAFKNGASCYVVKDGDIDTLLRMIRQTAHERSAN